MERKTNIINKHNNVENYNKIKEVFNIYINKLYHIHNIRFNKNFILNVYNQVNERNKTNN